MNYYDDLFNKNTSKESLEDKKTEQNIAALEDIFKNSVSEKVFEDTTNLGSADSFFSSSSNMYDNKSNIGFSDVIQKSEPSIDPLEKTGEIGDVDLETLRNYSKMLHEQIDNSSENILNQEDSVDNSQNSSQEKGKQKVLSTKPVSKYSSSEDVSQILSAFISCSILSFVTAGMGVGWLLYIIMHI